MLTYRKTIKKEDETFGLGCVATLPNTMKCNRRITRVVNNTDFMCEGHFQIRLHTLRNAGETIINQDEGGELLSGKSEPTEK